MRVLALLTLLCLFGPAGVIAEETGWVSGSCLNVYYFRGDFRCSNCYKIEQYTQEALERFFKQEIADGKLVYMAINVDKKENAHFVEEYGLYTKSVVVSLVKEGKEVEYKNLAKIWEYLDNKDEFYSYIREEVSAFLNKVHGKQWSSLSFQLSGSESSPQ